MTNFGWWADQVPEGYFLCCMCFHAWMLEFALIEDGERVDICWACGVEERVLLARARIKQAEAEQQPGHSEAGNDHANFKRRYLQPGPRSGPSE